jgi:hypothetical protein
MTAQFLQKAENGKKGYFLRMGEYFKEREDKKS